jgi:hypothetical protein
MVIFVWVIAVIALLFFWLSGHWFARILMFLLFALPLACLAGVAGYEHPGGEVVLALVGVAMAWLLSGLPARYHNHQSRRATRVLQGVVLPRHVRIEQTIGTTRQ